MDPDLTRLCAIPGNDDLTYDQAAEVLQLSRNTIYRLVESGKRNEKTGIESKQHEGRGDGSKPRVRIPRAALVRYLVRRSTGDKQAILAAIKEQCPQYLPAVADLIPGAAALPENVIPMNEKRGRGEEGKRGAKPPKPEHPGQLFLFSA